MKEDLQRILSESITIEPKSCVNFLRKEIGCTACLESCPTEAISFVSQTPIIQYSKCTDCGACVSVCPVLAIDHVQKPYDATMKQMEEHPEVQITCQRMDAYQKGIKVPCYLYLDVPLLLSYASGRETISFTIEPCETCEYAHVNPEQHFQDLQQQLQLYQIPLTIRITKQPLVIQKEEEVVGGISRRDLFKKFSIKNIREVLLPEEVEEKEEIKAIRMLPKEKSRYKRDVLHQVIKKKYVNSGHANEILPEAEFLNVIVDSSCVGCNICESLCPTQALYWEENEHESKLMFDASVCIACKNCDVCPENSLQFTSLRFDKYVQRELNLLKRFQRKVCIECGDEFRTNSDEENCSFCRAKNDKDPMRFFEF